MDKFKTRSMIFGVRIDNSQATTLCERIGDACGLKNNYCIGNSMVVDGENAFDSIYPWCEIKRCNIIEGKIIYDYEAGFTVEQDVFAEIPKFYSCRKVVGNIEEICISGHCHPGFEAEPCFKDAAGNELEHVYVAAYQTCVGSRSVRASVPQVLTTQAEFREAAKNKGFSIMDIATWLAIQKLVLIEFADRNMSNHLNGYGCLVYSDAVRAVESAVSSNTIICMGYTAGCFRVGQRVAVSPDGNPFLLADREITAVSETPNGYSVTFTGEPVDITEGTTRIYCSGQPNGQTDVLPYHTGRTGEENALSPFRYRWMENLWGNVWTMTDGVVVRDLRYYVTSDLSKYTGDIDEWDMLSYPAPEQNRYPLTEYGYIQKTGYDPKHARYNFPSQLETAPTHYGDKLYTIKNINPDGKEFPDGTEFGLVVGGGWDHLDRNGIFTMRFWGLRNNMKSWLYGSRMIIRGLNNR